MLRSMNKKNFIDAAIKTKRLRKGILESIEMVKQSSRKYKTEMLYLYYANLTDCDASIAMLDKHLAEYSHRNTKQDRMVIEADARALDRILERQKAISALLRKEEKESLDELEEILREMGMDI